MRTNGIGYQCAPRQSPRIERAEHEKGTADRRLNMQASPPPLPIAASSRANHFVVGLASCSMRCELDTRQQRTVPRRPRGGHEERRCIMRHGPSKHWRSSRRNVSVQPSPHKYSLPKRLSIDAAPTLLQATAVTRRRLAGVLCVVRRELNRRLAWRSTCQPRALEQTAVGLPLPSSKATSSHRPEPTHCHSDSSPLLRPSTDSRGNTATSPRGELQRPPASLAAAHH